MRGTRTLSRFLGRTTAVAAGMALAVAAVGPAQAASGGTLTAGQTLQPGQAVLTPSGNGELVMGTDGNLVLDACGHPIWASGSINNSGAYAIMQGDGNFVVYNGSRAIFNTGTNNHAGAYAAIQDDHNFVVYGGGRALWNTGSYGDPNCTDRLFGITEGGRQAPVLTSADGSHSLVSYYGTPAIYNHRTGGITWEASCNPGSGGSYFENYLGSLLEYNPSGNVPPCYVGLGGKTLTYWMMQNDGNLVEYSPWHGAIWNSGTAGR